MHRSVCFYKLNRYFQWIMLIGLLMFADSRLHAASLQVAVASNFTAPMKAIATEFERETGHKIQLAFGSTGQFYAQIRNGAPFVVLLAADQDSPQRLAAEGHAVKESAFTYARGRLVLWSKKLHFVDSHGEVLKSAVFSRLAIANPKLAPYGAAAVETLNKLGLYQQIAPKIVEASSIAQTYQFVASENADLGFVAMSQVFEHGKLKEGSGWLVPAANHRPINQDAVLLKHGQSNSAAVALLSFLRSEKAKVIIRSFGYDL